MRRFFSAIGMITVAVLAIAIAAIAYPFHEGGRLDREATAYSVQAVSAIIAAWDEGALSARAAPPLAQSLTKGEGARVFTWLSSLGPLQDTPVCQGNSTVYAGNGGSRTTATVSCTARYKLGPATIQLALTKAAGAWTILGFHVTSPMLLPQSTSQKA